ncbi:uncharacterized protein [Montipora capricornis]|uniref:uncharacterized protein n=1 Tax=Montipora capricornis TaxID=246305 RepID=UPI0035F149B5
MVSNGGGVLLICDSTYRKLRSTDTIPPAIRGSIKHHKDGNLLRPIVSSIGSALYNTSKFLTNILAPLQNGNGSSVPNSSKFVDEISNIDIKDDEIMLSFDVVSLFTAIPVKKACDYIKNKLDCDESLHLRTKLDTTDIISLLNFVLSNNYFVYNNSVYKQIHGCAMGSPVSPVVANLCMEAIEEMAINTTPVPPKVRKRYVDDSFCIIKRNAVDSFHNTLNSIDQHISFTIEEENNNQIAFLDALVTRKDNDLIIEVYRKPTHTDRYLDFFSHHDKRHKTSTAETLLHRATNLPSTKQGKEKELIHVIDALRSNNYPQNVISNILKKKSSTQRTNPIPTPEELVCMFFKWVAPSEFSNYAVLPYINGISQPLTRLLKKHDIRVVSKPFKTLQQEFPSPKSRPPIDLQPNVVYKISCADCPWSYQAVVIIHLKLLFKRQTNDAMAQLEKMENRDQVNEKVKKFMLDGYGSALSEKGGPCSRQFSEGAVLFNLNNCQELSSDELDLVILANIQAFTYRELIGKKEADALDVIFIISRNLFVRKCFCIFTA